MSVINDALKAAQREFVQRSAPGGDLQLLEGFFPFADNGKRGRTWSRPLVVGGILAALIIATGAVLMIARPRHPPPPTVASVRPPSAQIGRPASPLPSTSPTPAKDPRVVSLAASAPDVVRRAAVPVQVAAVAGPILAVEPSRSVGVVGSDSIRQIGRAAIVGARPPAPGGAGGTTGRVTLEGPPPRPSDSYVNQGIDALNRGDYAGADAYFQSAQSIGSSRELFYDWGLVRERLDDFAGAADRYRRALALDPTWVQALLNYARVEDSLGRVSDANAALDKAKGLEPDNVQVMMARADQYHWIGDLTGERLLLSEAVKSDRTNARAHLKLANVLLQQADTADGVREYNVFLQYAGGELASTAAQVRTLLRNLPPRLSP